jgi:hypothetical protein
MGGGRYDAERASGRRAIGTEAFGLEGSVHPGWDGRKRWGVAGTEASQWLSTHTRARDYDVVVDCMPTAPSVTTLLLMLASRARCP